ncbi:Leishmanolysin-like peptidase [Trichinella pseudospiralis]|uniref:Leishmanolysin-like peptidase n=1 Tax=Trichinella pseudospiralis TaxID=6337 RepID=A0A0V0XRF7_TRIPS|nr:Leishmanolysin-like peptidase [Trichinella pseudospiralis]
MRSVILCFCCFSAMVFCHFVFRTNKQESPFIEKTFKPIRIRLIVSNTFSATYGNDEMAVFREAFKESVHFLKTTIRVRRLKHSINLHRYGCINYNNFPIADHWLKNGVPNTDLIFFVDLRSNASCAKPQHTLAFALSCAPTVNIINRPVLGYVGICKNSTAIKSWNVRSIRTTMIHEMMHIMAFNSWSLYIIEAMINNVRGSNNVEQQWKVNDNLTLIQEVNFISTPRVTKFVREHFNCPDLKGAQLEDNGGSGTKRSHWKKRLFGNEIMTGKQSNRAVFSALTSALLEDSSWYLVNYLNVEELEYGKGAGCIFAQKSCREYMDSVKDEPFAAYPYCNWADFLTLKQTGSSQLIRCNKERSQYLQCNFVVNKSTSDNYKYFRDKKTILKNGQLLNGIHVSGNEELFNYCPVWQELHWRWWLNHFDDSICQHTVGDTDPDLNFAAESRGPNAICIEQKTSFAILRSMGISIFSLVTSVHDTRFGAGCYEYKCYRGRLMLRAASKMDYIPQADFKICWHAGALLRVTRHFLSSDGKHQIHRGTLICPSCQEICTKKDKNFQCQPDATGIDSRDLILAL